MGIAGVVAAVAVATVYASRQPPARRPIPLPLASAIAPGIGIDVAFADGSGGISCTAGFLVRAKDGQAGLLVAGHCNRPGGPSTVAVHYGSGFTYPTIGTFTETVFDGTGWDDYDIALISLDRAGTIPLRAEVDGHRLTGVAERVEVGDLVCHLGVRSEAAKCGPVAVSEVNKIRFAAPGKCGDSGGPVYTVCPDGTAEAVGIYVAVSNGDDTEPRCTEPQQFSIAQRIGPWLGAWELTLATGDPPG